LTQPRFAKFAGLEMQHVPYKGTQEAVTDVTGGRGHAVIVPTAGVGVYLQEPRLRVIGLTANKRSTLLPHIPTLAESSVPGFVFESWFGLLAPAGTPPCGREAQCGSEQRHCHQRGWHHAGLKRPGRLTVLSPET